MTKDGKDLQHGIERQPDQTDEAWASEVMAFLDAHEESRPDNLLMIETHVKRSSWKTEPFGETVEIPYVDRFSPEEFETLKRGLVPGAMEDKWFIYYEDEQLFLHRSWTGIGTYKVRLKKREDGSAEVLSAHYAAEYREASELDYGVALLSFLIGNLLLDRDLPFPMPAGTKESAPGAFQHHMTGTGYPEKPSGNE